MIVGQSVAAPTPLHIPAAKPFTPYGAVFGDGAGAQNQSKCDCHGMG